MEIKKIKINNIEYDLPGGAQIDDTTKSATTTWSSNKIDSVIDTKIANSITAVLQTSY